VRRLVIGTNWLGDAVMSLPFLRAIRAAHPGDFLLVLAPRGPAAIYRAEGSADEVWTRSSLVKDAAALAAGRFDEAWLLPNSFRAALYARASGAHRRIGYATDARGWLLTHSLAPPSGTEHQLRDYDALLSAHGIVPDREPPRLVPPDAARRKAQEALEAAGVKAGDRLVLLAPGSAKDATKRWPAERFAMLGDLLARRRLSCAIVVGPAERALGAAVSAAARAPLPVLGADLDPVELSALLSGVRLLVSNDSGPMHLAAAVGTPVVAFFGPTDPGRTAPTGAPARVLDRYVFCSPCFRSTCPYGHECMKEITVEMAFGACEELLSERVDSPQSTVDG
jgi:lipopolysaccharide heptosyltransferase II